MVWYGMVGNGVVYSVATDVYLFGLLRGEGDGMERRMACVESSVEFFCTLCQVL